MDAIDLLNCSPRVNAIRDVEFHADAYDIRDLTRIKKIIAGTKIYNAFYNVFPVEINGVLHNTTAGLTIRKGDVIIFHPSGIITTDDYSVMQKMIQANIKPSETTVFVEGRMNNEQNIG